MSDVNMPKMAQGGQAPPTEPSHDATRRLGFGEDNSNARGTLAIDPRCQGTDGGA